MSYNRHPDVVGQALGLYGGYGYGPYGGAFPVIGADFTNDQAAAMQMQQAAAAQQAAMLQASFLYGCGAPPAVLDPNFRQRELKSVMVGPQCGPQECETFLPFDNAGVWVEAGQVFVLTATAQVPCKVIGIKFGSQQASNFDITDGKVGIQPLFANTGVFTAVTVQENATHGMMNTPTMTPGQRASLTVRNSSDQKAWLSPVLRVVAIFYGGLQISGGPYV